MADLTLYKYLKKNLKICYKTTDNKETYIRCPICGDSKKDKLKARFYIHNEAPFKYYCFNCEAYGIMNGKLLNEIIDGRDSTLEMTSYLNEKIIESAKNNKYTFSSNRFNHPYFNDTVDFSTSKVESKKIKYLENRLGTSITDDDIERFKLVLNFRDFIEFNNLKKLNIDKEEINTLSKNYIGFLSSDRNTIIFRSIFKNTNDKKGRYKNVTLFDNFEGNKVYNISKEVDITKEYNLIMTEGIIDILSVYKNIYEQKKDIDDYIFVANNGKSYNTSIKKLAEMSIFSYKSIIIYSDKDVDIDFYDNIKRRSAILNNNQLSIYYNNYKGEKDFGVPKNKIKISSKITL